MDDRDSLTKMQNVPRTNSIGWLEIVFYAAALLLGLGSIAGAWVLGILIPLILCIIVYGIIRDAVSLSRVKTQERPSALPDAERPPSQIT